METALAVQRLTRNTFSVWATLSTSGMVGLDIPPGVKRLEIYADGDRHRLNRRTGEVEDPPGIRAANSLRERAQRQGIETVIFPSPEPDDWLDVYQAKVRHQRLMQRRYGE
ncbi:toprim domain-containing protein [Peteryoungia aggregata]